MPDKGKSAKRIKEVRLKLGLSMQAFAELIDDRASSGTVSNWENGANLPNNNRMKRIADLGHVDLGYLRGDSDDASADKWWTQLMESAASLSQRHRDLDDAFEEFAKAMYGTAADEAKLDAVTETIKKATREIQSL
ncbi:helix-turn-helix domain-containing protein [Lactiplantibacillus plantarum]|uniref:helix-turn-helix domain-containing protein n=1 Tax=Lactiplantibacillus plantarum TaxID=1590 RepID=UPI000C7EAA05|nr:helix-turn-helix transcriptional regulator [Lactiplantibacillus plantarum]